MIFKDHIHFTVIPHASNLMLKILQDRIHQFVHQKIPDVQAAFKKGRGTRDQIVNICWITEKAREFQKNIYFCFVDCEDHKKKKNVENS